MFARKEIVYQHVGGAKVLTWAGVADGVSPMSLGAEGALAWRKRCHEGGGSSDVAEEVP